MQLDLATKLLYATDLAVALTFFIYRFPRKKLFLLRLLLCLTVYMFVNLFVSNIDGWIVPVSPIAMFAVLIFTCRFCFFIGNKGTLYCCMSASLLQHIASQTCYIGKIILENFMVVDGWTKTGIFTLIIAAAYTVTWMLIKDKNKDIAEIEIKPWKLLSIMMASLVLIYVLWEVAIDNGWYNVWVYNVSAAMSCFVLLELLCIYNKENKEQKENELIRYQLAQEQRHYAAVMGNIELINRKCHDLKYEVAALYSNDNTESQKMQIKKLEGDISIYESLAKTGNIALDNILSEKSFLCKSSNIHLEYLLNGKLFEFIEPLDIYVLLGNALDNAIECVKEYSEEDKRYICIRSVEKGDMVILHIENFCKEQLKFDGGLPVTAKKDKNYHGFGTKSIRYIAEKYGGSMTVAVKNDMFNLDILWQKR